MARKTDYYRLYLNEILRKFLGINLRNKKIYIFKLNNIVYISTDVIPKHTEVIVSEVKLGNRAWYIRLPKTYLDYTPVNSKLLNTKGKLIKLSR